ncbi:MAG: 4'-phosphopantetheinyl transferase superfamily protein [Planctomycetia bacterium]|nr:4'-phosphopantetheinyl transferase superfamily protein [Planctomycetia bacterium]
MRLYHDPMHDAILLNSDEESLLGDLQPFLSKEESSFYHAIQNEETARNWRIARFLAKFLFVKINGLLNQYTTFPSPNSLYFSGPSRSAPSAEHDIFYPGDPDMFTRDLMRECERIFPRITVRSRNDQNKGIPPVFHFSEYSLNHLPKRFFSISHSEKEILVLFGSQPGIRVGCDIIPCGSITDGIVNLFFQPEEKELVEKYTESDDIPKSIIWGIKEAVYKRVCIQEPFDPLTVSVRSRSEKIDLKSFFYASWKNINFYDIRVGRVGKNIIVIN